MFGLIALLMMLLFASVPAPNAAAFTSSVLRTTASTRTTRQFRTTRLVLLRVASPDFYYDISKLPCNEGTIQVERRSGDGNTVTYNIAYKIVRPMSLSSRQAAPVVVLHGGPSLPSDYLYPLARVVPYRSIVFYDQLGCGESEQPTDPGCYSMDQAVIDLEVLLKKLSLRRFHLYGQSFGGCLAYEYLRRRYSTEQQNDISSNDDVDCLSVVLSSSPTNIAATDAEYDRLLHALGNDQELFRKTYQCRTPEFPKPLQMAYAKVGRVWSGTGVVADYVAQPPPNVEGITTHMPSCLVLRGEYDFVTPADAPWNDVLLNSKSVRERVLPDCSHHGLLEDPVTYGDILESFFAEYD